MPVPTTVAFPVVDTPVPEFIVDPETKKELSADDFRALVLRDLPHWLYHLRVEPAAHGVSAQRFNAVDLHDLELLHRHLGLAGGGAAIHPLEYTPGLLASLTDRSPYAFGLPQKFPGHSS